MQTSIAEVIHLLEEFLTTLDNAYWESSNTERKDTLYDIINIFHIELRELAKLSVEDHYLGYEAISPGARNIQSKLRQMQAQIDQWALRTCTADHLRNQLPLVAHLLSREV
jgi:hypothetical protein